MNIDINDENINGNLNGKFEIEKEDGTCISVLEIMISWEGVINKILQYKNSGIVINHLEIFTSKGYKK